MEQLKFSNWLDRPKLPRVFTPAEWARFRRVFAAYFVYRDGKNKLDYWQQRRCRWPRPPLVGPVSGAWAHG